MYTLIDIVKNAYYFTGHIGSVAWNNAETHLLYIAEKKVPKSKSYFEKASISAEKETETEVVSFLRHKA